MCVDATMTSRGFGSEVGGSSRPRKTETGGKGHEKTKRQRNLRKELRAARGAAAEMEVVSIDAR